MKTDKEAIRQLIEKTKDRIAKMKHITDNVGASYDEFMEARNELRQATKAILEFDGDYEERVYMAVKDRIMKEVREEIEAEYIKENKDYEKRYNELVNAIDLVMRRQGETIGDIKGF